MQRPYIVIPEGTTVLVVDASSPRYAASKARGGKGERLTADATMVTPGSATTVVAPGSPVITPGQLSWTDDGETIERT